MRALSPWMTTETRSIAPTLKLLAVYEGKAPRKSVEKY